MRHRLPSELLNHVCETLLTVALISLLALMVPAVTALVTWKNVIVDADLIVPLVVRPPDVLFIWGQLMTLLTLWMYFRCFVPFAKEGPWAHLRSLALAVALCLNNYFAMLEPMLPYRGFFVSLILLITWIDDRVFRERWPGSEIIRGWHDRVLATLVAGTLASIGFAVMVHPTWSQRVIGAFQRPANWDNFFATGFYIAFAFITTRSFRKNYLFFQDPECCAELDRQMKSP